VGPDSRCKGLCEQAHAHLTHTHMTTPPQILCSRMKILALPVVALPAGAEDPRGFEREAFAPNILKGFWEHRPEQKKLKARLR
jgi:hypothetical protein